MWMPRACGASRFTAAATRAGQRIGPSLPESNTGASTRSIPTQASAEAASASDSVATSGRDLRVRSIEDMASPGRRDGPWKLKERPSKRGEGRSLAVPGFVTPPCGARRVPCPQEAAKRRPARRPTAIDLLQTKPSERRKNGLHRPAIDLEPRQPPSRQARAHARQGRISPPRRGRCGQGPPRRGDRAAATSALEPPPPRGRANDGTKSPPRSRLSRGAPRTADRRPRPRSEPKAGADREAPRPRPRS